MPSVQNSARRWLQLTCRAHPEAAEAVSEAFRRFVPSGVCILEAVESNGQPEGWRIDLGQPATISAFIPVDDQAPSIQHQVEESLWHIGQMLPIYSFHTEELAEEDWALAWRQHFHVHRVGRRLVIKPSWRDYTAEPGDVVIELDPGLAFGTGLHPTTQMCLLELEEVIQPGMTVLDVGTGSAILSLAAARLGAERILACDLDAIAVAVARENVERNRLQDRVEVRSGTLGGPSAVLPPGQCFDLVVANIIADTVTSLMPHLVMATRPGGLALFSGIIDSREEGVVRSLEAAGYQTAWRRQQGDWVMLAARRPAC